MIKIKSFIVFKISHLSWFQNQKFDVFQSIIFFRIIKNYVYWCLSTKGSKPERTIFFIWYHRGYRKVQRLNDYAIRHHVYMKYQIIFYAMVQKSLCQFVNCFFHKLEVLTSNRPCTNIFQTRNIYAHMFLLK